MKRRLWSIPALALALSFISGPLAASADAVSDFYAGHAALNQGEADAAIASFSKAIEAGTLEQTQLAYVYHYRAVAFQKLERDQQAVDDYTQALALGVLPKRVQAAVYYNRAIALDRLQNFDRAIKDYTSAIALKPDYAEAYMNRGNAYRKLGDNQMALRDYDASAKYGNPMKHLPFYGRGLVLEQMGDKAGALAAFETALSIAPDFAHAKMKVAEYRDAGVQVADAGAASTPQMRPKIDGNGYRSAEEALTSVQGAAIASAKTGTPTGITAATTAMSADPGPGQNAFIETVTPKAPAQTNTAKTPTVAGTPPAANGQGASLTAATKPAAPSAVGGPLASDAVQPAAGNKASSPSNQAVSAAVPTAGEPAKAAPAPAANPPKVASASPASGGAWLVQVAAYKSEAVAKAEAAKIVGANAELLTGSAQDIQRADLGEKGVWYRLRFGSYASKAEADKLCTALKARSQSCNVVAGG